MRTMSENSSADVPVLPDKVIATPDLEWTELQKALHLPAPQLPEEQLMNSCLDKSGEIGNQARGEVGQPMMLSRLGYAAAAAPDLPRPEKVDLSLRRSKDGVGEVTLG